MNLFVSIVFLLVFQIKKQPTIAESTQCKHLPIEIEAEDGKNTELSFNLPMKTDELNSWTIYAASGFSSCTGEKSYLSSRSGYVQSCFRKISSYNNDTYENFKLTLSQFGLARAGTWTIRRSYEKFDESGSFLGYMEENNSINVYRIQFDQRFHNKTIEVRESEYIVMYFRDKSSENTACHLHHDETGDSYDLNEESYRFYEKGAAVQRFGPCGFRMHVRNTSEGEWTLFGQFGWTRHRATFQVLIKPQIHRPSVQLFTEIDFLKDDLPSNIIILLKNSSEYWELERPDGHIIQPSDTSLMDLLDKKRKLLEVNVFLGATSNTDQGIWKARVAYQNEAFLSEDEFFLFIEDAPYTMSVWSLVFDTTRNEGGFKMKATVAHFHHPWRCSFKKENETFVESKLEDDYSEFYLLRSCSVIFYGNPVGQESVETSFDFEDSKINSIITFNNANLMEHRNSLTVFWYSVRPRKYVKLGEELEVKCIFSDPLAKCVLNRGNGTSYIYGETPLLKSVDCYDSYGWRKDKLPGYCGCILTIAHATEENAGNWTCDMKSAEGQEIQSIVQILVMKSLLIPEIEMKNDKVTLHCRTFPTLYHDKIGYCKWYLRTEGLIFTENSTKYYATKQDHVCSLQLDGLNEKDISEWTCVARLHFAGIVNATFDLQKLYHRSDTEIIVSSSADMKITITIPFVYWYISVFSIFSVAVFTAYFIFRSHQYTRCKKYHQRDKYLTI